MLGSLFFRNFVARAFSSFFSFFIAPKFRFVKTEARLLLKSRIFQAVITIPILFILLKLALVARNYYEDKYGSNRQVVNNRGETVTQGSIETYGYSEDHPNRKFL